MVESSLTGHLFTHSKNTPWTPAVNPPQVVNMRSSLSGVLSGVLSGGWGVTGWGGLGVVVSDGGGAGK